MPMFTVVLRYPDYLSDASEIFVQSCKAGSTQEAADIIRGECIESNGFDAVNPKDFLVELVMAGDVEVLADSSEGL